MPQIPLSQRTQQAGVVSQPRASASAAAAPWQAVAQAGQAISQVGGMLAKTQAALREKKQNQLDSVEASNYQNSLSMQATEVEAFRVRQLKDGQTVTPEQIAEINEKYTQMRVGYISNMSKSQQTKYNAQLGFDTNEINAKTGIFFEAQEIEMRDAKFQSNYNSLLKAGKFDEADLLVEEAEWLTGAQKVNMREIGAKSVHTANLSDQTEYSSSMRTAYDNGEIDWKSAHDLLLERNKEIKKSGEYTQDEAYKLTRRNSNAASGIKKQAKSQADVIVNLALSEAKSGNSIQGILDEQGAFLESVYPNRVKSLVTFENSKTMIDIQDDAVKRGEATNTALWRLNTNRADLAERVAKQTGFWRTKFFDPKSSEKIDSLIDDILVSKIPKEDKLMLSQLLVEKSKDRVSGHRSGGELSIQSAYSNLASAYSGASSEAGNPNYWNTFFDDYQEIKDYSDEHTPEQTREFTKTKVDAINNKANADLQQSILSAKIRGDTTEPQRPTQDGEMVIGGDFQGETILSVKKAD